MWGEAVWEEALAVRVATPEHLLPGGPCESAGWWRGEEEAEQAAGTEWYLRRICP